MNSLRLTAFILAFSLPAFAQSVQTTCAKLNELNTAILTGGMPKSQAAARFKQLIGELNTLYKAPLARQNWVFPLQGYKPNAIGGVNGNGYHDKGYHFLDGNKHAAHPAHDIFIQDRNQDCIGDHTLQPVKVLAVADGLVIACTDQWQPGSKMRGGKYICIYHPQQNLLTYYAHNRVVKVNPGDEVKAGQVIAEAGRTGFNAYQKRSPTHLHFSAFHLVQGLPVPFNCYQQLKHSQYL